MRFASWTLGWTLCTIPALADAPGPVDEARVPSDFAEGLELAIEPGLAVQTLLLPLEVYRGTRDDLRDLSIFNAKGEAVPFALRSLRAETLAQQAELAVPVFPLRQLAVRDADLTLHVKRNTDGTIVDIHMLGADKPSARTFLTAYLLDASKLEHAASRLRLELDFGADSFTTRIQVDASDDLAHWHSVADRAVVGRLSHAGQSIERTQIALTPTRAKFLRLRWGEGHLLARLRKALLSFEHTEQAAQPSLRQLRSEPVPEKQLVFELDLGARLPLTAIAPRLPANALVSASLALRASKDESGETVFDGQLYRVLHEGAELASAPIELAGRQARYVSLRVDARTRAALEPSLTFDVSYAPEQLLFVTRGPGPYLLAFGSHKAAPAAFDAGQLLAFIPEPARKALPVESAKVSRPRALAGPAARTRPPPARSYRIPVLWTVLILGAGMLAMLALRMLKRR